MTRGRDPIQLEIVRHALVGIAGEMKVTLVRCAYNPIIFEAYDFSTGVFDPDGRLAAQAAGLPIFLGTLDWAVQAVVDKYADGGFLEGDVYLSNDPYEGGGTHLNDVSVITPAFSGGQLIGFAASRAHWTDVGGAAPLSVQTDAREIHGEGLLLPVIRLRRGGVENREVADVLRANIRPVGRMEGDLRAQLAAASVGCRRMAALARRTGPERLVRLIREYQDRSAHRVALALRRLPDFEAAAEDSLDDDGIGGPPAAARVCVRKQGEHLVVDFTGTDAANPSGYNCSLCGLVSAIRVIFKALVDPESAPDDGSFRALRVIAPEGSFISAVRPTAVSIYGEPARRAIDAVWRAFSAVLGERVPAGHYGTIAGLAMAGTDDRSANPQEVSYQGPNAGGWGASAAGDGESALCSITNGDTRNTPAELIEHTVPLRVCRYELRPDSCGAGRYRGGLGLLYEFEVLTAAGFALTSALGRTATGTFGAAGGGHGACTGLELRRDGRLVAKPARATATPLRRGDRVLLRTGGGGGFGPAAERSPEAVRRDLTAEYITEKWARQHHPAALAATEPALDEGGHP